MPTADYKTKDGKCECGCGEFTTISDKTDKRAEWIRGKPRRFISGHNRRGMIGNKNPNWKGGYYFDLRGYKRILKPNHPHADSKGYIPEHIYLAEKALGKELPSKAVIHHYGKNLVICQNQSYHLLLHKRMRENANAGL